MKRNLRGLDFNPVRSVLLLVMLVALLGLPACGLPKTQTTHISVTGTINFASLEELGYIAQSERLAGQLKYIEGDGWFVIDYNWKPYPLMFRLDIWKSKYPKGIIVAGEKS